MSIHNGPSHESGSPFIGPWIRIRQAHFIKPVKLLFVLLNHQQWEPYKDPRYHNESYQKKSKKDDYGKEKVVVYALQEKKSHNLY